MLRLALLLLLAIGLTAQNPQAKALRGSSSKKNQAMPTPIVNAIQKECFGDSPLPPSDEMTPIQKWKHASFDLNGDKIPDYIVAREQPGYCGSGGCGLLIFLSGPNGYKSVYSGPNFYSKCSPLKTKTNGCLDLLFTTPSGLRPGGGQEFSTHKLQFDGTEYQGD